ncbi:type II restriction endonuclease subunit M [Catellatospora sp. TT07R-123]|uniref:N-6 DNA methylase n=1 Tax=Catellatospora sp. TT07R-123 TaxID=2733863 RepID=UPI001B2D7A78|nr:N-6 DNA methylase [Catellatospora sp. TT07R-123]GHJ47258.1 type II restriction endonuclease subunit M [Catellatospora sp. TT07R-123]
MSSDRSPEISDTTLTASGIAQLANVGRAAVSNWRRRYADFPAPVGGTATSPVFDARAVEQWLRTQNKLSTATTEQWLWRHIENYSPATHIGDALCIAGAFLLVTPGKPARGGLPTPHQLLSRVRTRDRSLAEMLEPLLPTEWSPQLEAILRGAQQLSTEMAADRAFEYLHTQYVTSPSSMSGLAATPEIICDLMVDILGEISEIFDFTTGTGSILHTAATRALTAKTALHCHGQEIKPQYAIITLLRLLFVHARAQVAGVAATRPPDVRIGDSLLHDQFTGMQVPTIAANFPFGLHGWGNEQLALDPRWAFGTPPRTEPELAWVQHALAHLAPGGRATVLMPPACAVRPAGRRIRAELVRRGALEAVIALPAGLMPPTGIGLQIWVLARPYEHQPLSHQLLMVDGATLPRGSTLREVVGRAWQAYLDPASGDDMPGVYRVVPAIEVLDDRIDLTPRRHLPQQIDPADSIERTMSAMREFERLLDAVRAELPAVRPADPGQAAPSQVSLADLIRSGSLEIHRSIARTLADAPSVLLLTTSDVLTGRPPSATSEQSDSTALARVQAGDILVPVHAREVAATVATAEQVGAALDPGVQAVRVNPDLLDPWFVAGMLSKSDNVRMAGRTSSSSTGVIRIDLRRLTIPVMPLEQQQHRGAVFQRVAAFRTAMLRAGEAGDALARGLSDGLASGQLTGTP